jgi:hypothetical protein
MENYGAFCVPLVYLIYGHLVSFMAIRYSLWPFVTCIVWPFGIFCGHLVYFSRFGMLYKEKFGNPAAEGVGGSEKGKVFKWNYSI